MNNKEFTSELSRRLGYNTKYTSELITSLLSDITQELQESNAIGIQGFGTFEVKKKAERIVINPVTKLRLLVPPKFLLNYWLTDMRFLKKMLMFSSGSFSY